MMYVSRRRMSSIQSICYQQCSLLLVALHALDLVDDLLDLVDLVDDLDDLDDDALDASQRAYSACALCYQQCRLVVDRSVDLEIGKGKSRKRLDTWAWNCLDSRDCYMLDIILMLF